MPAMILTLPPYLLHTSISILNTRFNRSAQLSKDYLEAVKILEEVKPKRIVSNNTGIAYKAVEMGI